MRIGKSLAKTNQRTINALIAFLVWIMFFHSASCNAFVFGVEAFQSPKTPSKTILFTNNDLANTTSSFLQLPYNSSAITTSSFLQLPNDKSSFKQLSVPHNGPAHFKQLFIPTTTKSTGLQAYNDCTPSLDDVTALQAFSTTNA
jgi:hypothetical protein